VRNLHAIYDIARLIVELDTGLLNCLPVFCRRENASTGMTHSTGPVGSAQDIEHSRANLSRLCNRFSDLEWAVIVYHSLLAASQVFLDFRESANCVRLAI